MINNLNTRRSSKKAHYVSYVQRVFDLKPVHNRAGKATGSKKKHRGSEEDDTTSPSSDSESDEDTAKIGDNQSGTVPIYQMPTPATELSPRKQQALFEKEEA